MSYKEQVPKELYDIIVDRYHKFLDNLDNPNVEPVQVHEPLTPQQLQELQMIREVSRELQAKKEEDGRKAALAKEAEKQMNEAKEQAALQDEPKAEN